MAYPHAFALGAPGANPATQQMGPTFSTADPVYNNAASNAEYAAAYAQQAVQWQQYQQQMMAFAQQQQTMQHQVGYNQTQNSIISGYGQYGAQGNPNLQAGYNTGAYSQQGRAGIAPISLTQHGGAAVHQQASHSHGPAQMPYGSQQPAVGAMYGTAASYNSQLLAQHHHSAAAYYAHQYQTHAQAQAQQAASSPAPAQGLSSHPPPSSTARAGAVALQHVSAPAPAAPILQVQARPPYMTPPPLPTPPLPTALLPTQVAAPKPAPAPAHAKPVSAPATAWPPALETWATVQLSAVTGADSATATAVNKEVFALVNREAKAGTLWSRDWSAEQPVPTVRAHQALAKARIMATQMASQKRDSVQPERTPSSTSSSTTQYVTGAAAGGWGVSSAVTSVGTSRTSGASHSAGVGQGYISLSSRQEVGTEAGSGPGQGLTNWAPTGSNALSLGKPYRGGSIRDSNSGAGSKRMRPFEDRDSTVDSYSLGAVDSEAGSGGGRGGRVSAGAGSSPAARKQAKLAAKAEKEKARAAKEARKQLWQPPSDRPATEAPKSGLSFMMAGGHGVGSAADGDDGDIDWSKVVPVQGTSSALEKRYLRLIAPPDPSDVRPLPVLKEALELVKGKYAGGARYMYVCEQLKSIRQDLAVQHILNPFTATVYETHARVALENQDPEEYNKCQAQLFELYRAGIHGCKSEFIAYRMLYASYSGDLHEARRVLASMTADEMSHPWVAHAIAVRAAVASSNWARFFKLYDVTLNMGQYVLDLMMHRTRIATLQTLAKGMTPVKPGIPLVWLRDLLRFDTVREARTFAERCGGVCLERQEAVGKEEELQHPEWPVTAVYLDPRLSNITQVRQMTQEEQEFAKAGLKLLAAATGSASNVE